MHLKMKIVYPVNNSKILMEFAGSCGQQGYRSNGTYVEGWHGVCGTGNPYYLLCSTCRDRYLAENRAMSDSADCASRNIPYAKLLLMAPDLLGSTEKTEQGMYCRRRHILF